MYRKLLGNPFAIFIFTFILFSMGSFYVSFFPPDEPKYVDAALRMIEKSNYIIPFFNCHVRFDKPILYYLELVGFFKLFSVESLIRSGHDPLGIIEYSARLPSIITGSLIVIFTYLTSLELFKNREAAVNSAVALLSVFFYFYLTRAVYPDASLILFELISIYLFIKKRYLTAWVFVALAFLTKGPIGILTPGFTYFLYLWVVEKKTGIREFFSLKNIAGFIVFLIISAPWYVAMYHYYGVEFINKFLIYHNIERFTGKAHQHPHSFFYYLPFVAVAFYFWLPYSEKITRNINISDRKTLFLMLWFLWIVLFFSISRNKLAHYIAPAFIPASILIGLSLQKVKETNRAILIGFAIFELIAGIATAVYLYRDGMLPVAITAIITLALLALMNGIRLPANAVLGKVVLLSIAGMVVLLQFESYRPEKRIWHTVLEKPYKLYEYKINNQSLVAYTRRCLKEIRSPSFFLKAKKPFYIYTKRKHLNELPVAYRVLFFARDKGTKTAFLVVK